MKSLGARSLTLGLAIGLAACTPPPTPFVAENQPAVLHARQQRAEAAKAKKEAERLARQQAAEAKAAAEKAEAEKAEAEKKAAEDAPTPGQTSSIPLDRYFERHQAGTVLTYDVRPAFIHRLGHIPGAVSWPESSFDSQLPTREPEIRSAKTAGKIIVIYCTDTACPDARNIADRLARRGHSTSVLAGGWDAWKSGGLPTS